MGDVDITTTYAMVAMEHNHNIYKNAAKTLEEFNNSRLGRVYIENLDGTTYVLPKNCRIKFIEYTFYIK